MTGMSNSTNIMTKSMMIFPMMLFRMFSVLPMIFFVTFTFFSGVGGWGGAGSGLESGGQSWRLWGEVRGRGWSLDEGCGAGLFNHCY